MQMLSSLGRTEVRLVEWPWSHHLFVVGMFFAMLAVASAALGVGLSKWGAVLNIAGLAWLLCLLAKNAGRWARIAGALLLCVPIVLFAMEQGGAALFRSLLIAKWSSFGNESVILILYTVCSYEEGIVDSCSSACRRDARCARL